MLKWEWFGYTGLNKILKLTSLVYFYFLMWLLENVKLHMWLTFVVCIIFLLNSCDLDNIPKDLIGILIMCQSGIFPPNPFSLNAVYTIRQWLSTRGNSTPQGTFGNVWGHFCLSQVEVCYWPLEGIGLGCWQISHKAQDSSPNQRIIWLKCQLCLCWETLLQGNWEREKETRKKDCF